MSGDIVCRGKRKGEKRAPATRQNGEGEKKKVEIGDVNCDFDAENNERGRIRGHPTGDKTGNKKRGGEGPKELHL